MKQIPFWTSWWLLHLLVHNTWKKSKSFWAKWVAPRDDAKTLLTLSRNVVDVTATRVFPQDSQMGPHRWNPNKPTKRFSFFKTPFSTFTPIPNKQWRLFFRPSTSKHPLLLHFHPISPHPFRLRSVCAGFRTPATVEGGNGGSSPPPASLELNLLGRDLLGLLGNVLWALLLLPLL